MPKMTEKRGYYDPIIHSEDDGQLSFCPLPNPLEFSSKEEFNHALTLWESQQNAIAKFCQSGNEENAIAKSEPFTPKTKREVIRTKLVGDICYQLEKVKCGKPNCQKCPHGPYWYGYQRVKGKVKSFYHGKTEPEGLKDLKT